MPYQQGYRWRGSPALSVLRPFLGDTVGRWYYVAVVAAPLPRIVAVAVAENIGLEEAGHGVIGPEQGILGEDSLGAAGLEKPGLKKPPLEDTGLKDPELEDAELGEAELGDAELEVA